MSAARTLGPKLARRRLCAAVALSIVAIPAVASTAWWTQRADTPCDAPVRFSRIVNFELTGTSDGFATVAEACAGERADVSGLGDVPNPAQISRDHSALIRDYALIGSYLVALLLTCHLGALISKRDVTRRCGRWLMGLSVAAAACDVVENLLLWDAVGDPAKVGRATAGWIAGLASTKFMFLAVSGAYGLASLGGGLGAIVRRKVPEFRSATSSPEHDADAAASFSNDAGRQVAGDAPTADPVPTSRPTSGICFSGGGIRSASFTIGCLRTMQARGVLHDIDYMSTVSGGGYAAMAWQTAARHGIADPFQEEAVEYQHLERHARYLWPPLEKRHRWTSTVGFVRVLFRVLISLAFNIGLLIALLYVVARPVGWWGATWVVADDHGVSRPERRWQLIAACAQGVGIGVALSPALKPWWRRMASGPFGVVLTALTSVAATTLLVWMVLIADGPLRLTRLSIWMVVVAVAVLAAWSILDRPWRQRDAKTGKREVPSGWCGVVVAVAFGITMVASFGPGWGSPVSGRVGLASGIAVSVAGLAGLLANQWVRDGPASRRQRTSAWLAVIALGITTSSGATQPAGHLDVSVGLLLVIVGVASACAWAARTSGRAGATGFALAVVALGIAKMWLDDGFRNFVGTVDVSESGIRQQVRPEIIEIDVALRVTALILLSLTVLAIARLAVTHASRGATIVGSATVFVIFAVPLAAWIVVSTWDPWWRAAAVAALASVGVMLVARLGSARPVDGSRGEAFGGSRANTHRTLAGLIPALAAIIGAGLWIWRRDVSISPRASEVARWSWIAAIVVLIYIALDQKWWSPHPMYKSQLAKAFTPTRSADGSVEPDPKRDCLLSVTGAGVKPQLVLCGAAYGATERSTVQHADTSALPFEFSFDRVGGDVVGWTGTEDLAAALGRNTQDISLPAAAAISGAAVSQALGANRLASLSQLIAFLNLRLGVWLPSPTYVEMLRRGTDDGGRPVRWIQRRRFTYLLKEFTSRYDLDDRFLYVTDGGQFENLGLFALIRRRCTTIYSFDASGDQPNSLAALRDSMALAQTHLGASFAAVDPGTTVDDVLLGLLAAEKAAANEDGHVSPKRLAQSPVATLRITYDNGNTGLLHFGKARLWPRVLDEDEEVHSYAKADPVFPNHGTADQFPDRDQFRAYVALGAKVADELLDSINGPHQRKAASP